MARMIATAIQRGNVVVVYDEQGRAMCSINAGGVNASDGLQGYTPSTVSIRRGSVVYTYNGKGQAIQSNSAGPPTPKNNATARAASPSRPRPSAAPVSYAKSTSESAPIQRNWFQHKQVQQPIRTNPSDVARVHDYDRLDTDETQYDTDIDTQTDTDTEDSEISKMAREIPDWVRDLVLTSDRHRKRWKRLAITFMILFALLLFLIVLAIVSHG